MSYRNLFLIFLYLIFTNCTTDNLRKNQPNYSIVNNYSNKGFALIYNESLYNNKVVSKKIGERELIIFQKNLKKNSQVKITNMLNNKSLIANVGGATNYPSFKTIFFLFTVRLLVVQFVRIKKINTNKKFL